MAMSMMATGSRPGLGRIDSKRQEMFMKPQKGVQGESQKDPLPIVELKPFVNKVWRRENSLPIFYERYEQQMALRQGRVRDPSPTPPSPSPDKLEMFLGDIKENRRRQEGPQSPKSKTKLHPCADTNAPKKVVEHTQSFVPGFITRGERAKSTMMEIQCEDVPTKFKTGLQQSQERQVVDWPSMVNLNGDRFLQGSSRRSLQYLNPFKNMYHKGHAWSPYSDGGANQYLPEHFAFVDKEPDPRPPTPFYDTFDRKGTLPSIHIGGKALRKKVVTRLGYDEMSFADPGGSSTHKIGGISNSLHLLSKVGNPTKVERQLKTQLEIDLKKYRKSRNAYFPFEMSPYELAKYYPPSSGSLTQGEIQLRKGLESNASNRKRRLREKSLKSVKSAPDKLEHVGNSDIQSPRDGKNGDEFDEEAELRNIAGIPDGSEPDREERIRAYQTMLDNQRDPTQNTQEEGEPEQRIRSGGQHNIRTHISSATPPSRQATEIVASIPIGMTIEESPGSSEIIQVVHDVPENSMEDNEESNRDVEDNDEDDDDDEEGAEYMDPDDPSRTFLTSGHAKVRPTQVLSVDV
ncbi:uncharacterized protein LOC110455119 [Mizuhopecten yessoensis]|uniref:Uncharacterized protein n=1 Tax=Mizuhopecten yessoensis TaxID=6573 RepID=A0A210R495_MIZYE|nr:uncharacterized protein LOC110455119 [Mizuhopecten yessoensis]OWF55827.1 hypothetical protein KP79_PYT00177 [Mizuhopecten yessoensis]